MGVDLFGIGLNPALGGLKWLWLTDCDHRSDLRNERLEVLLNALLERHICRRTLNARPEQSNSHFASLGDIDEFKVAPIRLNGRTDRSEYPFNLGGQCVRLI